MTEAQAQLYVMRGVIQGLPEDDQAVVREAYGEIQAVLEKYNNLGFIALSWAGAEAVVKFEDEAGE